MTSTTLLNTGAALTAPGSQQPTRRRWFASVEVLGYELMAGCQIDPGDSYGWHEIADVRVDQHGTTHLTIIGQAYEEIVPAGRTVLARWPYTAGGGVA
jgi:hypothetical protein